MRLRKALADAGHLTSYEPGGARPPRRKRLAKKCLRQFSDGGWKSGKWFMEAFEFVGSWSSAWLPVGPYNAQGTPRFPRRHHGEAAAAYKKRMVQVAGEREAARPIYVVRTMRDPGLEVQVWKHGYEFYRVEIFPDGVCHLFQAYADGAPLDGAKNLLRHNMDGIHQVMPRIRDLARSK